MATVIILPPDDNSITIECKKKLPLTEQQHSNWIKWYKKYIIAIRNGERPEYKSRESFHK